MRYFFSRQVPAPYRLLLVESGGRQILEKAVPRFEQAFGETVLIDLLTCYPGPPAWPERFHPTIYYTGDYIGRKGRARLFRELRAKNYTLLGIICSGEQIMTAWKWTVVQHLPAKTLIINENSDFFWFEWANAGLIKTLISKRSGLSGAGLLRLFSRAITFPFVFSYLLLYALYIHSKRFLHTR